MKQESSSLHSDVKHLNLQIENSNDPETKKTNPGRRKVNKSSSKPLGMKNKNGDIKSPILKRKEILTSVNLHKECENSLVLQEIMGLTLESETKSTSAISLVKANSSDLTSSTEPLLYHVIEEKVTIKEKILYDYILFHAYLVSCFFVF